MGRLHVSLTTGLYIPGRLSRDVAVVVSFTPVSFFVYGDDQFANLSAPFQNAMPLDTHMSVKPPRVPKFTVKLFAISFKLGFSSGIRELIDAQF